MILYYTILYCTILYSTLLYFIILYYISIWAEALGPGQRWPDPRSIASRLSQAPQVPAAEETCRLRGSLLGSPSHVCIYVSLNTYTYRERERAREEKKQKKNIYIYTHRDMCIDI